MKTKQRSPAQHLAKLACGVCVLWTAGNAMANDAVNEEAREVSDALLRLDQGFRIPGLKAGHHSAAVAGSSYRDAPGVNRANADAPSGRTSIPLPGPRLATEPEPGDETTR